jgi:hypothetical protein
MSQIFIPSSSQPPPPSVATSYQTQNGTAVPAANILLVNGSESTENNNNGIISKGGVAGTGTANEVDLVLTNRANVSATTTGAATQTVTLFTPTASTSVSFRCLVVGFDSANNICIGGEQIGVVRVDALGVVTVVGTNDTFDEADAAIVAADWNVVSSSPTISMEFVGVAAHTISWRALFEYLQVS